MYKILSFCDDSTIRNLKKIDELEEYHNLMNEKISYNLFKSQQYWNSMITNYYYQKLSKELELINLKLQNSLRQIPYYLYHQFKLLVQFYRSYIFRLKHDLNILKFIDSYPKLCFNFKNEKNRRNKDCNTTITNNLIKLNNTKSNFTRLLRKYCICRVSLLKIMNTDVVSTYFNSILKLKKELDTYLESNLQISGSYNYLNVNEPLIHPVNIVINQQIVTV